MRVAAALAISLLVTSAGCVSLGGEVTSTPTETLSCPLTVPAGPSPLDTVSDSTVSPSTVSEEAARERALCAEKRFLRQRLQNASCLEKWNVFESASFTEAETTVRNHTASGVVVEVLHPFTYTDRGTVADVYSVATYHVTTDRSYRVSGQDVSPCPD